MRENLVIKWHFAMKEGKPLRENVCFFNRAAFKRHGCKTCLKKVKSLPHLLTPANAALTRACCEFALFQSLSWFFLPTYFVKWSGVEFLEFMSLEREKNFVVACLFSPWNEKLSKFNVVVVQKRQEMYKKRDARAKLLFCLLNLLFAFPCSRCRLFVGSEQDKGMSFYVLTYASRTHAR